MSIGEKFTLWLNSDGQPVEKPLSEMTKDEVLAALEWHDALHARHARVQRQIENSPEQRLLERVAGEDPEAVAASLSEAEKRSLAEGLVLIQEAAQANDKVERFFRMVCVSIPQWRDGSTLTLRQAIARYWPPDSAPLAQIGDPGDTRRC